VHGDDRAHDDDDRAHETWDENDNHGDAAVVSAPSGGTDVSDARSTAPSLPLMQITQQDPLRRIQRVDVPRRDLSPPVDSPSRPTRRAGPGALAVAAVRQRLAARICAARPGAHHDTVVFSGAGWRAAGTCLRGVVPRTRRARTHCCSAADSTAGAANGAADAVNGAGGARAMPLRIVLAHSSRPLEHALQVALDESSAHVELPGVCQACSI
jgi:hypothetical protein